ncbi:MAG: hypothetical protein FJX67_11430 [Alphaproteobacteria bacterium]|nr:hypothetical protein [Alphaproteobacteria bacterium]
MARFSFYAGVFVITAATLMLQVIQTRILSVVTWYHLAFFVISIAMFGLTAGAVWVYLRRERFGERTLSADLAYFTTLFAVALVVALGVQMTLTPMEHLSGTSVVTWFVLAVCLATPFFFSGVVVSLALTRSPYPVGRIYGVDLVGAAVGCLGVLAVLELTDGPSAVLWTAALAMVAAILFDRARVGGGVPTDLPLARVLSHRVPLLAAIAAVAFVNGLSLDTLKPVSVKGIVESHPDHGQPIFERWNSFSRIAVYNRGEKSPELWGPSSAYDPTRWRIEQRWLNIDGDAATFSYRFAGDLEKLGFLRYDVTTFAYHLPDRKRSAVIGVGSGRDILSARLFGVPDITGVEINPTFIHLLKDVPRQAEFAGIDRLDGVRLVVDEARSWFARTDDRFDLIQMSLIDTWAATGAGAFSLSENGLYTVEAWGIFLDRLTPDGVYTVSRWFSPDRREEMGRVFALAMAALFDRGITEPRRHMFVVTAGRIVTLVMSRAPLRPEDVAALERAAAEYRFTVQLSPSQLPADPLLRAIAETRDRAGLDRVTAGQVIDLTPATDERPFFFNMLSLRNVAQIIASDALGVVSGNLRATITLFVLFLLSVALVLATIVVPLRPAIRDVGTRLAFGGTVYFFLIGVGFMAVEIALIQRLSVFLGHPIYALSIVLFSIIVTTGAGSLLSDRMPLDSPARIAGWATVLGAYVLTLPTWLPDVLLAQESAPILVRALVCVGVVVPAGLLMGFGFPTGMRLISAVDRRPTPWFWGINGAAGVLASSLAVACSIAWGISTTLMIGGLCYLLLIPAALAIGAPQARLATARPPDRQPPDPQTAADGRLR